MKSETVVPFAIARASAQSQTYTFEEKWGSLGEGNGQFNRPYDVAVDSLGIVYVADTYNDRIQKFTSDGTFLASWGTYGTGDGQFNYTMGVAVDNLGNVYAADSCNSRIQKFTSNGVFISTFGVKGSGDANSYTHTISPLTIQATYMCQMQETIVYKNSLTQAFSYASGEATAQVMGNSIIHTASLLTPQETFTWATITTIEFKNSPATAIT